MNVSRRFHIKHKIHTETKEEFEGKIGTKEERAIESGFDGIFR